MQGWHGVELSGFKPGESIAVFGAGPVGLMAAYSAVLRGASDVYVVDRVPERLQKAKDIGCIPIDLSKGDPAEQIKQLRGGYDAILASYVIIDHADVKCRREVDRGVDAVGYQAVAADGKTEQPNAVLEGLIAVVRPTGGLGIPGLYVPKDPGAPDSNSAKGYITFPFGKLFEKGLSIGTGQCNVKVRSILLMSTPGSLMRGVPLRHIIGIFVTSLSLVVLSRLSWCHTTFRWKRLLTLMISSTSV